MNYTLGLPPVLTGEDDAVIDIEMFGQDVKRLHRPHGTLACVQIMTRGKVYIQDTIEDARQAVENIKDARYWIGHNLKYDITQLRGLGIPIAQRKVWDTYMMERYLWNGMYMDWGLDDVVRRYLSIKMDKSIRSTFATSTVLSQEQMNYAAEDVIMTRKVFEAQEAVSIVEKREMSAYWEIDEPTMWVTMDMLPVKVNVDGWKEMLENFKEQAAVLEADLGVNVYSPIQVKKYIQERLGIQIPDTSDEVLSKIDNPIVTDIRQARMYRKAVSTYGDNWLGNWVEEDGCVYCGFNVIGAETFRMSSDNPNMQNIPSRKLPQYREMFITRLGSLSINDISQQEPRILAQVTGDKELTGIFRRDEDIHLMVARAVFMDDTLTKEHDEDKRFIGKTIGLGTSYGLTVQGLMDRTGLSEEDATNIIEAYFKKFVDVGLWVQKQRRFARTNGYVTTLGGHRIWINPYDMSADNNAINAPIQGSAADFTKMWMIEVHRQCADANVPFPLCNVIHDELVSDMSPHLVPVYSKIMDDSMQYVAKRLCPDIPFKMDSIVGTTWADKSKKKETKVEEDEM